MKINFFAKNADKTKNLYILNGRKRTGNSFVNLMVYYFFYKNSFDFKFSTLGLKGGNSLFSDSIILLMQGKVTD